MTPEESLRITLAAQREALYSAAVISSTVTTAEACVKHPTLAATLQTFMVQLKEGNTWEAHLSAIDKLFAAAKK